MDAHRNVELEERAGEQVDMPRWLGYHAKRNADNLSWWFSLEEPRSLADLLLPETIRCD